MIAHGEFIIGQIERLARAFLALELGIASLAACFAPLEEVFEGSGHIHKSPFNRALRDVVGPGKLFSAQRVKLGSEFERRRLLSRFVLPLPLGQRPVKSIPGRASGFCEVMGLFRRGVEPDLVRFDHPESLSSRLFGNGVIRTILN